MSEKILVVDDEKEIADLIEVYLNNENYSVIEVYLQNENLNVYKFYSGTEALAHMESVDFDLAILDIMLPDISGLSICQIMREKGCACPIIMLTAKDEETDKITLCSVQMIILQNPFARLNW